MRLAASGTMAVAEFDLARGLEGDRTAQTTSANAENARLIQVPNLFCGACFRMRETPFVILRYYAKLDQPP